MASYEPKSILVIDNELDILDLLQSYLQESGYTVQVALSGSTALKQIEQSDFDVVICDIKMPYFTGFDLFSFMLARGHFTPVIFMTGSDDSNYLTHALRLGAVDYLLKPFDFNALEKSVAHAILHKEKWRDIFQRLEQESPALLNDVKKSFSLINGVKLSLTQDTKLEF